MEMFPVIPDPEECGSSEMAVASHPLLSGLPDASIQGGDIGFDALPSPNCSPESSKLTENADECGSAEMAVASHPLLSGLPDASIQGGDIGFDALPSPNCSPESSKLTENADDCGSSVVAISSDELLSAVPDDTLKRTDVGFDTLSSLHCSLKTSKLTENTDAVQGHRIKSPEYFNCGPEPVNDLMLEEPTRIFTQEEKPHGDDVQPGGPKSTQDTALSIRDVWSLEAAVGGKRDGERQDGDVVVLSDTEGADCPQKESYCADVPGAPRSDERDREEVGDIVILEPTINKEVPASNCRESNSPRLHEEYSSEPDEASEDKGTNSGWVTGRSIDKQSQQLVTHERWQSDGASHTGVTARSWRKLATRKPLLWLTCNSCLKLFSSRYDLIRHVFVHVNDVEPPPHVCVMCGEVFATDEEVADHHKSTTAQCYAFVPVVKIHIRSPEEVWFCSTCEQAFETEHRLAIHKAERHLRTIVSACTELSVSPIKLDDLPRVRAENRQGRKYKRNGGRLPKLEQQEPFHRNYKRKPDRPGVRLLEAPYDNHKRTPREITVREPLNTKTGITIENPVYVRSETMLRGLVGKNSEITSGEQPGNRTLQMAPGEVFDRKIETVSGEPVHGINEVMLKEPLDRLPETARGETHHTGRVTVCGETFDRRKESAHGETFNRVPETPRQDILDETPESECGENFSTTLGEPVNRTSAVAPGMAVDKFEMVTPELVQNICGIIPGEPVDSTPGAVPNQLIDGKPKKRRGRPPGSKNKGPSKPRAKKLKTVPGQLLNGTTDVTVGKPRPGECINSRLLEMTPGVPLEIPDEMRSGAPPDGQYGMRSGEYLYDLIPGEVADRPHEITLGEHLYGLQEIGPREQLYNLHEMTPRTSIDSNPSATPRDSLDKVHDMTQGEPLYRLHEMTTVESVHRLHEMSPVEILYRNLETTPGSPLDRIPGAEPLSSLHEMTPMEFHYGKNETKTQMSTPGSLPNTVLKMESVESFDRLSEVTRALHRPPEMAPREPLHKLTEMAPVEPLHRLSEMTPAEIVHGQSKMALGETLRRSSEITPGQTSRGPAEMPPEDTLRRLSEMEPRDPLHTLFEMATGDPFYTLFEMEPGDLISSPSKTSLAEPYSRQCLSKMAPGTPLDNRPEVALGNFVDGVPKKRRGRPPGSKNRFPGKPRCKKPKTEPGDPLCTKLKTEPRDTLLAEPLGALSDGIPEILMGECGDKKPDKNPVETEKWPCHFCRQLFCSLSGLKRHLVRHTGERNYVCDLCGKSFGRSDNLRVHKYTHTGGLPFKCDICGRTFSWACHLRDHKRKCQSS